MTNRKLVFKSSQLFEADYLIRILKSIRITSNNSLYQSEAKN